MSATDPYADPYAALRRQQFDRGQSAARHPQGVDSRSLQPGERVRLHTGAEGEWHETAGKGSGYFETPPAWEGEVVKVTNRSVHIAVQGMRTFARRGDEPPRQVGGAAFGRKGVPHSQIKRVTRLA